MTQLKRRLERATVSEKGHIAGKIRNMTPGAERVITDLSIEER